MDKTERIPWVDVAKGIAILTILIQHAAFIRFGQASDVWGLLTKPYNVIIFAYLGGVVFKRERNLIGFLRRRMYKLLLPYYAVGLACFAGWLYLVSKPSFIPFGLPWESFLNFLAGKAVAFNGTLWFLPAYFISSTLYQLTHAWVKKHNAITVAVLILLPVIAYFLSLHWQALPFSLDLAVLFLFFTVLRGSIERNINSVKAFLPVTLIFAVSTLVNGQTGLYGRSFQNYFLFLISAVSGCMMIEALAHFISSKALRLKYFLAATGRMSLILLAIHWPLLEWLTYGLWQTGILREFDLAPDFGVYTFTSPWISLGILKAFLFASYLGVSYVAATFFYTRIRRHKIAFWPPAP